MPSTSVMNRLREYAELVKLEHSIFALPFALSALLLATPAPEWPAGWTWLWVTLAMVGGRTYAMALNRLADAQIDAQNPRTRERGIPAGRVKRAEAIGLCVAAFALFLVATAQLPPLCLKLFPLAVLLLTVYSWMKRFSVLCHLVLGLCLGAGAIGGWVAVRNSLDGGLPVVFGLATAFWVMGFDILYACQDVEVDRHLGLYSIPASVGVERALQLSRVFHVLCVVCLLGFGVWYRLAFQPTPVGFWLAVIATAGLLAYEHRLVSPDDLTRVNEAFFKINGFISIGQFCLICASKWL